MFSSFEVRPLVSTATLTLATQKASSSSACSSSNTNCGDNENDDNDKTPKVRNPKQMQTTTETTTMTMNVQDYVQNFTELASNCIDTAYSMERTIHQSPRTGRLSTCLPEDVFSLLDIQYHSFLDFLVEHKFTTTTTTNTKTETKTKNNNNNNLTVEGQGLLMGVLVFLFRQLQETQDRFRPLILNSSRRRSSSNLYNSNINNNAGIEECCAAANDFLLMSEKMEVFLERLQQQHGFLTLANNNSSNNSKNNNPFEKDDNRDDTNETSPTLTNTSSSSTSSSSSSTTTTLVQQAASDLILRWSQDAVIAVERVQVVWMRHVHTQTFIATDLFSPCWEDDWTHNDVVLDLLQNLHDDVLGPMEDYYLGGVTRPGDDNAKYDDSSIPNQVLYQKALVACCRALVCFYIQCLVQKADAIRRGRRRNASPAAALRRRTYQLTTTTDSKNTTESSSSSPPYEQAFKYASRAVLRMTGDVQLIQEFFLEKTADSATLSRIVGDEMRILEIIQECLTTTILPHRLHLEQQNDTTTTTTATSMITTPTTTDGSITGSSYYNNYQADADSLESFILVIHKRIGADPLVTNMFMNDLWLLVAASSSNSSIFKNKEIDQTISTVEQDLHMVSRGMQELGAGNATSSSSSSSSSSAALSGGDVSFVRLDEMLKAIYEDRLVQGVLPLSICWNCLPKTTKCSTTNANDEIVSQTIRTWARNLTEVRRWKFTNHLKPKQQARERHNWDEAKTTTPKTKTAAAETTTSTASTTTMHKIMTTTTTTTTTTAAIKTTTSVEMKQTKSAKTSLSFSSTAAEI